MVCFALVMNGVMVVFVKVVVDVRIVRVGSGVASVAISVLSIIVVSGVCIVGIIEG